MFSLEPNLPVLALSCAQLNSNKIQSWLLRNLVWNLHVYVDPRPEAQSSNAVKLRQTRDVVIDLARVLVRRALR